MPGRLRTPAACLIYAGTYTGAQSKGIYAWRMDMATGSAHLPGPGRRDRRVHRSSKSPPTIASFSPSMKWTASRANPPDRSAPLTLMPPRETHLVEPANLRRTRPMPPDGGSRRAAMSWWPTTPAAALNVSASKRTAAWARPPPSFNTPERASSPAARTDPTRTAWPWIPPASSPSFAISASTK